MTKGELVKAAQAMDIDRGALPKLRAQQKNARGANPGALEEWCPPSPCPLCMGSVRSHTVGCPNAPRVSFQPPKAKRTRALPPTRAACDTLMDGDRLAAHITQCAACQAAGARLQVSTDGATWTNYTGAVAGVEAYGHVRCVATVTTPWLTVGGVDRTPIKCCQPASVTEGRVHLSMCRTARAANMVPVPACVDCGSAPAMMRHVKAGPLMLCGECYLSRERAIYFKAANPKGIRGDESFSGPERLERRAPLLAHSFGIEDPALPNA